MKREKQLTERRLQRWLYLEHRDGVRLQSECAHHQKCRQRAVEKKRHSLRLSRRLSLLCNNDNNNDNTPYVSFVENTQDRFQEK